MTAQMAACVAIASKARGLPVRCAVHGPTLPLMTTAVYRRPAGWTVTLACGCALDDLASITSLVEREMAKREPCCTCGHALTAHSRRRLICCARRYCQCAGWTPAPTPRRNQP